VRHTHSQHFSQLNSASIFLERKARRKTFSICAFIQEGVWVAVCQQCVTLETAGGGGIEIWRSATGIDTHHRDEPCQMENNEARDRGDSLLYPSLLLLHSITN
jgi:hypothetical protein